MTKQARIKQPPMAPRRPNLNAVQSRMGITKKTRRAPPGPKGHPSKKLPQSATNAINNAIISKTRGKGRGGQARLAPTSRNNGAMTATLAASASHQVSHAVQKSLGLSPASDKLVIPMVA